MAASFQEVSQGAAAAELATWLALETCRHDTDVPERSKAGARNVTRQETRFASGISTVALAAPLHGLGSCQEAKLAWAAGEVYQHEHTYRPLFGVWMQRYFGSVIVR